MAQVEVEGVLVLWQAFPGVRREQLAADWVRRTLGDVVPVWKAHSCLCHRRSGPRRPIVGSPRSDDRDAAEAIVGIARRMYVKAESRLAA